VCERDGVSRSERERASKGVGGTVSSMAKEWPKYTKFTPTPTLDNFPLTGKMEMFVCLHEGETVCATERAMAGQSETGRWLANGQTAKLSSFLTQKPPTTCDIQGTHTRVQVWVSQCVGVGSRVCVGVWQLRMCQGCQSGSDPRQKWPYPTINKHEKHSQMEARIRIIWVQ